MPDTAVDLHACGQASVDVSADPEVTLRLLATMEYVKETLAELDAEVAMLPARQES